MDTRKGKKLSVTTKMIYAHFPPFGKQEKPETPMSRRIFKYQLSMDEKTELWIPNDAPILGFGFQGLTPVLWAEVDIEKTPKKRDFYILPTGAEVIDKHHIGTVQLGTLVWHLYEYTDRKFSSHV